MSASEEAPKEEPTPVDTTREVKAEDKKPAPALLIPEGPISQSTSMDSFRTPTEELRSDTSLAEIAASVPLPTSSEPSPARTPTGEQPLSAGPSAVEVEIVAPTPTTATTSAGVDEKAQSQSPPRTDSPAPPPLPRRAAARARPSSMLVPQVEGEQPKQDSVDVPAASEANTVTEEHVSVEKKPEEESKEVAVPAPESSSPSDASAPAEPATVTDAASPITLVAEPELLPASNEPTAAPTPEPAAVAAPIEALQERLETASAPPEDKEKGKVVLVNGHTKSVPEPMQDVPPPAYAAGTVNGDKTEKDRASVADETDNANGLYVGDATWEERTYKELVRLREEMFWARIGAVVQ